MICPNCKCEYVRGITECADCGVHLVNALEPPDSGRFDNVRLVAVWSGRDTAECDRVKESLEKAGIPFTLPDSKSPFGFLPTEPSLEILISEDDREKARQLILDLEKRVNPDELTPEQIESLALPESSAPDDSDAPDDQPEDLPEYWYEDGAAAEVWSGESEELADTLTACLREVGIPSHKAGESSPWSLVVPQKLESRAKEVVREVVDASPPE
jgi:hypothetical protein